MFITGLEVENIRIIKKISLTPENGINLIHGKNGSGKTSVLEAISIAAAGRSFISNNYSQLISRSSDFLRVNAHISLENDLSPKNIGIEKYRNGSNKIHINFQSYDNFIELANNLTIQTITPEIVNIVLAGASVRRTFVNWSLFHINKKNREFLFFFNKLLKYRNKMLKSSKIDMTEFEIWTERFCEIAEVLTNLRLEYVEKIQEIYLQLYDLFPESKTEIIYEQGWKRGISLREALDESIANDRKYQKTTLGPHLSDLRITIDNINIRNYLSRGQAKMMAVLLKFSQIIHYIKETGKTPVILIDDMISELDLTNLQLLINFLKDIRAQCFITAIDPGKILNHALKVFHVKHGKLISNINC